MKWGSDQINAALNAVAVAKFVAQATAQALDAWVLAARAAVTVREVAQTAKVDDIWAANDIRNAEARANSAWVNAQTASDRAARIVLDTAEISRGKHTNG